MNKLIVGFIIVALSALFSLTAFAQQGHKICIQQPRGGDVVVQTLLKNALTKAAIESGEYQPVERPSTENMLGGVDLSFKYMLFTEINELFGKQFVTVKIVEAETSMIVRSINREFDSSLNIDKLCEKCAEIASELFDLDKR